MPLTIKFIGVLRNISGKTQINIDFQEGTFVKRVNYQNSAKSYHN